MENEDASEQNFDNQIDELRALLKNYPASVYDLLKELNTFKESDRDSEAIAQVQNRAAHLSDITTRTVAAADSVISSLNVTPSLRKATTAEQLKKEITQDYVQLKQTATSSRLRGFSQECQPSLAQTEQGHMLLDELGRLSKELQIWDRRFEDLLNDLEAPGLAEYFRRNRSLLLIRELGFDPYPHKFDRSHTASQIVEQFAAKTATELEASRTVVSAAGRIHAINMMKNAVFIRLRDGGVVLQIYIKLSELDYRTWSLLKILDLGDFIGVEGRMFRTRTSELSIYAESLMFLAKAITPPPDKHYGLNDIEIRYRQRYADLITNRDVRQVFEKRAQTIRLIRSFFDTRGYIEVETPMLTPLPTGAAARPFRTHHNALDIDLYARIAPELYLKRLIVGGFEKVYEINRNFRNEGIDRSHNPEFTMLEFYEAYSDFESLIELTKLLISGLVEGVCGQRVIRYGEQEIDFTQWKRMTMREAVIHYWPTDDYVLKQVLAIEAMRKDRGNQIEPLHSAPTLEELSTKEGVLACIERSSISELQAQLPHLRTLSYGYLLGEVFEHVAEPQLINPIFITEFPTELSPLSKKSKTDPAFVERFELFIAGMEIANGFSEINDPEDQRKRFEEQMQLRKSGDDEAMLIDEDYIRALSYGMPPTAGEGIGIDRLVMVLTDSRSIRDVILFPHMRPERAKSEEQSAKSEEQSAKGEEQSAKG